MIDILRGVAGALFTLSFAIFIHELGHFMFAKLFGVKVETFSIGFGKKLIKFRKGDTEYCLSAIPLGGYVKMVGVYNEELEKVIKGEDDASPQEERAAEIVAAELEAPAPATSQESMAKGIVNEVDAMRSKAYWQKILILSAGCINNFLTAVVTFFLLYFIGHNMPAPVQPVVGDVGYVSVAESPIKTGDLIVSVAGKPVTSWDKFLDTYADTVKAPKAGAVEVGLVRGGTTETVVLPPVAPVGVELPTGTITKVNQTETPEADDARDASARLLSANEDATATLTYKTDGGTSTVVAPAIAGVGPLWPTVAYDPLTSAYVEMPMPNLPAEKAGMQRGDTIIEIDEHMVLSAHHATKLIRERVNETVPVVVLRRDASGQQTSVTLSLEVRPDPDKPTRGQVGLMFGTGERTELVKLPFVESWTTAFSRSWSYVGLYFDGIRTLFSKSFKTIRENVSGPIGIMQQAYSAASGDFLHFVFLFAVFNIILAITNMLPLPVLDGGHILFATIEAIIRRPLPARFMLFVYNFFTIVIIGLALLITLNDVVMNWWRVVGGK